MKIHKTIITFLLIFMYSHTIVFAQTDNSQHFELSLLKDSLLLGSGTLSYLGTEYYLSKRDAISQNLASTSISGLDSLLFATEFNSAQDKASTITELISAASPILLSGIYYDADFIPFLVSYSEAIVWTLTAKNLAKSFFPKTRPYMYSASTKSEELQAEGDESFFSGHAAVAFCGASSILSYTLLKHRDKPLAWLITAGSGLAAFSTATLRVSSGNHFISDVATGALVGSLFGALLPLIHKKPITDTENLAINPSFSGFEILVTF